MNTNPIISLVMSLFLLTSCSQNHRSQEVESALGTASSAPVPHSSAGTTSSQTNAKFIRTAQFKFKVDDVPEKSILIEDVIFQHQGFILSTNLKQELSKVSNLEFGTDSIEVRKSTHFTNTILFRVPNLQLDSTLRILGSFIKDLDYRIIKAEDAQFAVLEAQMQQKIISKQLPSLEALVSQEEAHAKASLQEHILQDKIDYATVELLIYDNPHVISERIINEALQHESSFKNALVTALFRGWDVIRFILLGLVTLWPFWISGGIAFWVYRRYFKTV